jgi:hypothetical protein
VYCGGAPLRALPLRIDERHIAPEENVHSVTRRDFRLLVCGVAELWRCAARPMVGVQHVSDGSDLLGWIHQNASC